MTIDRRALLQAAALAALAPSPASAAATEKPKYRLGLVTWNVASLWDLPTVLKLCKTSGVSPVELRTTHKHGVEPSLSKDQRKEVRQKFADAGVEFWGCGSACDFHWPDATRVRKQIELCKQFVELAADLGGKGVKVRPNDIPAGVPVEKTLEQIGKSLRECGKAAEGAGVEIWLEVHGTKSGHPPYIKTMMEQADHKSVGITWNSNATDLKGGSVKEYFALLRPWLKSCHINNLWKAEYPWRELFGLLTATGYDRTTLIETPVAIKEPDAGLEFLRYYKALWTELTRPAA
jgi:sugar phosphate isomerase/epimerase